MALLIELHFRDANVPVIDLAPISPTHLAPLSEQEIASIHLLVGRKKIALGELAQVKRSVDQPTLSHDTIIIHPNHAKLDAVGRAMSAGRILVEGSVAGFAGEKMTGGHLHILGNAGVHAGCDFAGGVLQIDGVAGDFLGAASPGAKHGMTDGLIVVNGNGQRSGQVAGRGIGQHLRRGTIYIAGDVGEQAGARMIAGSIYIGGQLNNHPGLDNKRGSIVALTPQKLLHLPLTYKRAGVVRPSHLPLVSRWLAPYCSADSLALFEQQTYARYLGDHLQLGKGEILVPQA